MSCLWEYINSRMGWNSSYPSLYCNGFIFCMVVVDQHCADFLALLTDFSIVRERQHNRNRGTNYFIFLIIFFREIRPSNKIVIDDFFEISCPIFFSFPTLSMAIIGFASQSRAIIKTLYLSLPLSIDNIIK